MTRILTVGCECPLPGRTRSSASVATNWLLGVDLRGSPGSCKCQESALLGHWAFAAGMALRAPLRPFGIFSESAQLGGNRRSGFWPVFGRARSRLKIQHTAAGAFWGGSFVMQARHRIQGRHRHRDMLTMRRGRNSADHLLCRSPATIPPRAAPHSLAPVLSIPAGRDQINERKHPVE